MSGPARPRVLLLHGWGGTAATTWHDGGLIGALTATGREILAIDLPGHGPGEHSHDPADYADLASSVDASLPFDEVLDGVGFSLGAKVLLDLTVRQPGRFRRLVLGGLGGNVFAPEQAGEAVATALVHGVNEGTAPAVRALVEYGTAPGNDPLALAACLRRPANPVIPMHRLADLHSPVLLIAGDQDGLAQPLAPLAEGLPVVEIETIPGLGHLGLPGDERFHRSAAAFLQDKDA